jgi:C-terminal processing protease CtpA/Prc
MSESTTMVVFTEAKSYLISKPPCEEKVEDRLDTTLPPQTDMPKKNKRKAEEEEKEEKEEKEEEGEEDDYEDPNDGEYEEKPKKGSAKKGKKKDEDEDEKAADDDDDDDSAIPTADLKKKYVTLTLVRKDDSLGLSLDNNHVTAVKPGGAAAEAGVLVGDIIVEVMGKDCNIEPFGSLLPKNKSLPVKLKAMRFVKDDGVKKPKKPKTTETEGEASTSAETKPDETKEEPEKEAQADEAKEETKA